MSKQLSGAAEAVKWAANILKHNERSNSDIVPLRNEEQEGYGMFDLKLGVQQLMYRCTGKYNKALTIMAVLNRVQPAEAMQMFTWLYGDGRLDRLEWLATTLYHRIVWPTDTGTVDPRAGIQLATNILLRQWWYRRGEDYDIKVRPWSPTFMSRMLNLPLHPKKGAVEFRKFQHDKVFPVLELWEMQADNQISDVLADKGMFGG